jgi:hypothetical protein
MKRTVLNLFIASLFMMAGIQVQASAQDSTSGSPQDSTAGLSQDSTAGLAQDSIAAPRSDSAQAAFVQNAARGREIFVGSISLENGGPSCISCHNITSDGLPEGGLLAKDLTHVFGRLGEGGISAMLGATPFPAMASAYKNKPLTTKEKQELVAFLEQVEETVPATEPRPQYMVLMLGGGVGIFLWMGLVSFLYFRRKKESVKKAIYDRQIH